MERLVEVEKFRKNSLSIPYSNEWIHSIWRFNTAWNLASILLPVDTASCSVRVESNHNLTSCMAHRFAVRRDPLTATVVATMGSLWGGMWVIIVMAARMESQSLRDVLRRAS